MRPFQSPSTSPARKRQRISLFSPTYDDQVGELSQEDLAAFDEIEAKLSQSNSYPSSSAVHEKLPQNLQTGLHDDPDNPFAAPTTDIQPVASGWGFSSAAKFSGFGSAAALRPTTDTLEHTTGFSSAKFTGFGSAATLRTDSLDHDYARSPSPEVPTEQDYDAWFAPASDVPLPAFQTAAAAVAAFPQDAPIGFMKASNKGWIEPSSTALAKAKEKMDAIWAEEAPAPVVTESQMGPENLFKTASAILPRSRLASPERPALRSLENATYDSPGTPSPIEFPRPSASSSTSAAFASPTPGTLKGKAPLKPRPFKSPFLPGVVAGTKPGFAHASSPLNPRSRPTHPLAAPPFVTASAPETPLRLGPASASFVTPVRPMIQSTVTPRMARSRPAFVTPFKTGMKPGEPGRTLLEEREKAKAVEVRMATPAKQVVKEHTPQVGIRAAQSGGKRFFDLTPPAARQSLLSSGLVPQEYTAGDLEGMGIAASELKQITPALALYYSFHTPSSTPPSDASPSPPKLLGPDAALEELLERGCTLATKLWVDNHWALILWKLAGMVCLDPARESDPQAKRWCWAEVMRQLLYRYERELNGGVRPPLRCVATQDAPASCPMILCVSNITWSEPGMTDDGMPIPPHPELEVTDGWYRLRAQVDAPLARAVRRGVICVGRKIGVVGARLHSERKDASEVLEAYNSTNLVLSGNSSHLVPWHAKLGFQISPWVATMHSLTADGGMVAAMDLVILKTYPIAFLEFIEDENGEKQREGPRNERDEAEAEEKWKRRREVRDSKLREELAKKEMRFESYAERLERRAGTQFSPDMDSEPTDELEELYDELEDPAGAAAVMSRVSRSTAGWLARFILNRAEKERERAGEEIDQELRRVCPPREVRNFRVLIVQDACTRRRGANRSAQLTVWDVVGMGDSLEVGKRYLATNLVPTAQNSWMDCEPGSEIYLSTRRDSRWKRL
ncbi:hypothetical protein DFH08DRAFT_844079 [Mycena albidolilacea]|uniref:BRCA2 OB1 domain-containing protein n=1 Tax=Mycena albidolilacea TaxID=1033008 RepID=A0AAD7AKE8_9AGAR|nr:hypothetical protein DFH08DRAFT_844079 [Mycena albidolilacea]